METTAAPPPAADSRTRLRHHKRGAISHGHPVNVIHHDEATFGERLADGIAAGIGSWTFLIVQTFLVLLWVGINLVGFISRWDPYPFILLNLMFSVQAAYTGPVLLLAGNRQSQKDRLTLEHAAAEAEKADVQNEQILSEIKHNTEVTVQVLENLVQQRKEFIARLEQSGVLKPQNPSSGSAS